MPSTSYPGPNHNAGAVAELEYERLVGRTAPEGVFGHPDNPAPAYADGTGTRTVWIRTGMSALVRGFMYEVTGAPVPVLLEPNTSGATRYDLVMLRLVRSSWQVIAHRITGVPGAGAEPPPTRQDADTGSWDVPLARVRVASGATTLAPDTVTRLAWYIGPDGNIRCTPDTRPPMAAGRRIWEPSTGRALISDGTSWFVAYEDSGEVPVPSIGSGWRAVNVWVRRRSGMVTLQCDVARDNSTLNEGVASSIANLPHADYYPRRALTFPGSLVSGGGSVARVVVSLSGLVRLEYSGGLGLTSMMTMTATWPAA